MQFCLNGSSEFNFKDNSFIDCIASEQEKIWKKYNWKAKNSPNVIPKFVQKSSLKSSKVSHQNCPKNCKCFPLNYYGHQNIKQCMIECRKNGVVSKKITSLLSFCIEANGKWKKELFHIYGNITKVETMWKFSLGLLNFCTSETCCF